MNSCTVFWLDLGLLRLRVLFVLFLSVCTAVSPCQINVYLYLARSRKCIKMKMYKYNEEYLLSSISVDKTSHQ